MIHKFAIIISISLCCSISGFTNIAGFSESHGGILMPVKNEQISMENENIKIEVNKISWRWYEVSFACHFVFKNYSEDGQKVLMGFPIGYDYDLEGYVIDGIEYKGRGNIDNFVTDFRVAIENEEAQFEKSLHGTNSELDEIDKYDELYTFSCIFKPQETKKIDVYYKTQLWKGGWREGASLTYILKSALTWKKPIQNVQITVRFNFPIVVPERQYFLEISPKGAIVEGYPVTTVVFNYSDYTPSEDLKIYFGEKDEFPYNTPFLMECVTEHYYSIFDNIDHEEDGALYFAFKAVYDKFIKQFSDDQLKVLQYSIPAYHGFIGTDDGTKSYLDTNFYTRNIGSYTPRPFFTNREYSFQSLSKEEKFLFNNLSPATITSIKFDYNEKLSELIDRLQERGRQLDCYNLLRFLRSIDSNKLEQTLKKPLLKTALSDIEDFTRSFFNNKLYNYYSLERLFWDMEESPILVREKKELFTWIEILYSQLWKVHHVKNKTIEGFNFLEN